MLQLLTLRILLQMAHHIYVPVAPRHGSGKVFLRLNLCSPLCLLDLILFKVKVKKRTRSKGQGQGQIRSKLFPFFF